jgi:hypothetical protein
VSHPPSYALFCQGPLKQFNPGDFQYLSQYKWAPKSAAQAAPASGYCAWANRTAQGAELQPGGNMMFSQSDVGIGSYGAGTFFRVCIYKDPSTSYFDIASPPLIAGFPINTSSSFGCT